MRPTLLRISRRRRIAVGLMCIVILAVGGGVGFSKLIRSERCLISDEKYNVVQLYIWGEAFVQDADVIYSHINWRWNNLEICVEDTCFKRMPNGKYRVVQYATKEKFSLMERNSDWILLEGVDMSQGCPAGNFGF
jgi:hypothetical protein